MRELDPATALAVLREHRLLDAAASARAEPLGGGVSSRVFRVRTGPDAGFVLKQPLPRFRVREEWIVDERRADVEARFASLLQRSSSPAKGARLRAYDEKDRILVFDLAPSAFGSWKERLLAGDVDARLGAKVGEALGAIHNLGLQAARRQDFDEPTLFDQQRIDPYLRATLRRHPDLRTRLQPIIDHLVADRTNLIHGDFSPKNILTDGRSVLLVDHEVATWNDPAFDIAFLTNHLLLKSAHLPAQGEALVETARRALDAYDRIVERPALPRHDWDTRILAALMLARVDGKSPAEYLTESERVEVRGLAMERLRDPPPDLDAWFDGWPAGD